MLLKSTFILLHNPFIQILAAMLVGHMTSTILLRSISCRHHLPYYPLPLPYHNPISQFDDQLPVNLDPQQQQQQDMFIMSRMKRSLDALADNNNSSNLSNNINNNNNLSNNIVNNNNNNNLSNNIVNNNNNNNLSNNINNNNNRLNIACFILYNSNKHKPSKSLYRTWLAGCDGGEVVYTLDPTVDINGGERINGKFRGLNNSGGMDVKAVYSEEWKTKPASPSGKNHNNNNDNNNNHNNNSSSLTTLLSHYPTRFRNYRTDFETDSNADNMSFFYDYYLFTGIDTYIVMDNLREYLNSRSSSEPHGYGNAIIENRSDTGDIRYTVGGSLVLSAEAVRRIVGNTDGLCHTKEFPSPHKLLSCLAEAGGSFIDTRDTKAKNTFLGPFRPYKIITGDLPRDYAETNKYSPSYCDNENCLSDFPIAFHKVDPYEIYLIDFLITWAHFSHYIEVEGSSLKLKFNGSKLPISTTSSSSSSE
ncbi:hypothetical protein HELRODRAFT_192968 [Helobdella robusta]|uniref:Hexosyltransferase n=1 Tax=Helobdella robusta TaxID=6412 RepID=T1FUG8_HELRO|nr:hypothetical protein HELRODRAFT_192968 [Helobdella robusta]ESN98528.1 hypothetical protein HELRODRAFT_192968 [Helobdella robusta]